MAEFIVMPKLGFDMREGVLVGWTKEVGEMVNRGDVVAEIESDKATLEVEAQVSGVLLKTLANADDVVPVGSNLAVVGDEGEDISDMVDGASAGDKEAAAAESDETAADDSPAEETPADDTPATATEAPSGEAVSEAYPGGVKATPVARRMAEENKVDLRQVDGSGPQGRIRKADVEQFMEAGPPERAAPRPTIQAPAGPETTEVPLSRLRQAIARRMTEIKKTIPQFYVSTEIDMGPALALRKQINATLEAQGIKVSVNDMVVKACGLALRDFPNINASFAGDKLVHHNQINVGSAVAIEGGLMTVVQKNTDLTPLAQIAQDNKEMIERARSGKVKSDDVSDGTFTVSNLGAFDVDHFIAIINPPEAAILAIGSAAQVPVVVDGELTVGSRMKVTISADHRVTDGVEAAQFNQRFKEIMESPLLLLL
jgi:pyruvate dehydrogenase E2 component (dihydrolipoamide acetyltransferase)